MSADSALVEIGGRTATAVSGVLEMLDPAGVHVGEPSVLAPRADPLADFPMPCVAAAVSYVDGVTGGNVLVLTLAGARRLAARMMGTRAPAEDEAGAEPDELELSALSEAMNQMMATAAASTGELLGTGVEIGPPETRVLRQGDATAGLFPPAPHAMATALSVMGEPARLVQLIPNAFTARMTAALDDVGFQAGVAARGAGASPAPVLEGIPMRLTVELGCGRMRAARAVGLPTGAVVELDRAVDEPVDLLVNGVPFATGRLLVTDDGEWAVRVESVHPALPAPNPR